MKEPEDPNSAKKKNSNKNFSEEKRKNIINQYQNDFKNGIVDHSDFSKVRKTLN